MEEEQLVKKIRVLVNRIDTAFYENRNALFGKVATIIEATITDKEQRKSAKDLLSNAIYGDSRQVVSTGRSPVVWEIEMFAKSVGINELYPEHECTPAETLKPYNPYDDKTE